MSTTEQQVAFTQTVQLVRKHKDRIRQTLGPETGTQFSMKESFTQDDVRRLSSSLSISETEAQQIASVWPLYQLGYQDGKASSN